MPVLELTQLRLKGSTADDPTLLQSLSTVRAKLQTSSQFYNCIDDPTVVYILGIWPNLGAHLDFLASPGRDEILGPQEDMLQFCWTIHVELGGMSLLPLDAPVLAIETLRVRRDCVEAFEQAVMRHTQQPPPGSRSFKVAHGWRCDAASGNYEALIFSGWENVQAHITLTMSKSCNSNDVAAIDGQYETMQVTHARNMERRKS
ncbi:hypothetical protein BDW02DRAFT_314285 [Decorospora gaudefroyi]|uniref:ABM domain-containing protein n=1 Tax=Decorospora gaudefroyi TaxID=184978 RepID=A0A6A5KCA0_9PLEO|nr:hypothetical protein BDW02DRAFT_314285 [Decorospora gaudefroyi]